jgi:hypothetical protein
MPDHQYTAIRTPDGHVSVKLWEDLPDGARIGITLVRIDPEVADLDWVPSSCTCPGRRPGCRGPGSSWGPGSACPSKSRSR